jgi:hypothetical protein
VTTGSWLGRALLAVPVVLAAVGVGLVVVGVTGEVVGGLATTAVLSAIALLRAARTGVTIDLERQQVVLRTFWRTHRVDAAALLRVDAHPRGPDGPAGVRFVLRDGREYGSVALAYLAARTAERLTAELGAVTEDDPIEVVLSPRFRGPTPA